MRYLSAGLAPITGSDRHSICSLEKIYRPRLGLWVQKWYWDTEEEVKTLIGWAKDVGVTDIFLMAANYDVTPYDLMGYASACSNNITPLRYQGQYPFQYMANICTPLGINIHAWFCMFQYGWWCSPSTSFLNSPPGTSYLDNTSNPAEYMWKIYESVARSSVVAAIQSFWVSNRRVGIHLDYIRADGYSDNHTATDITNLVSEINTACPGAYISMYSITSGYAEDSGANCINQQPRTWVANGIMDMVNMGGYSYGFYYKGRQMGQIPAIGRGAILSVGFSAENEWHRPSDAATRIRFYQSKGYRNFSLFDSGATRWNQSADTAWKKVAQGINIRGDLEKQYPNTAMKNITSVQVNQGTNVVIKHDGVTDTVTWAQLGIGSATNAEIKDNFETTVGHAANCLTFDYDGSSLYVVIGDMVLI